MGKSTKAGLTIGILISVLLGFLSWGGITIVANAKTVAVLNQKNISVNRIVEEKDKSMRAILVEVQKDIRIIRNKIK